jgi:hypothetical protein
MKKRKKKEKTTMGHLFEKVCKGIDHAVEEGSMKQKNTVHPI